MATWNRWIAENLVDGKLVILDRNPRTGDSTGANPPDRVGKPARDDTATSITVFKDDRDGGGAKIIYHDLFGWDLVSISMKDGSALPSALTYAVSGSGNTLTVTDTEAPEGTDEWSYAVNSSGPSSDPQIHNSEE